MKQPHIYARTAPLARRALLALVLVTAATPASHAGTHAALGKDVSLSSARSAACRPILDKKFKNYALFDLDASTAAAGLGKTRGGMFHLRLGTTHDWSIALQPRDVRSAGYIMRVATRDGVVTRPRTPNSTYTGLVDGDAARPARLSVSPSGITGYVTDKGERLFIEPARHFDRTADPSLLITYSPGDVLPEENPDREENPFEAPASQQDESLGKTRALNAVEPGKVAEIAFAADFSMFEAYGSAEAVETRITGIMNLVNEKYEDPRLNITHEIVEFFVEASDLNTWGTTLDFTGNLSSLNSWSRGAGGFKNRFDICSLWWYYQGGGTIGIAGISVVCSQTRPGNVIRDYTKSTVGLTIDQTHELGHNWGANHISDATDIMYPSVTGKNTTWTAPTITAILNHKNSRTCLDPCDQPPAAEFSVLDSNPCRGTVRFVDRSRYSPRTWAWNFGDGTTSSEQHPVHNYLKDGPYTVSLTVTNDFGTNTATKTNYLTIDAPAVPVVATPVLQNQTATITATADATIRWYTVQYGGSPIFTGATFTTPPLTKATTYYVENGGVEFPPQSVGPADTAAGANGGYKTDAGNLWMRFVTIKPVRFRSITVYSSKAAKRHFVLTTNNLATTVNEHVAEIPEGRSTVDFYWDLAAGKTYELILENTVDTTNAVDGPTEYYNHLYRTREGITYPQTIAGVVSVTSNYWIAQNPQNTKGWYIGYDWKFQEIDPCASARIPVVAGPASNALPAAIHGTLGPITILQHGKLMLISLSGSDHGRMEVTLSDLSGRVVRRMPGVIGTSSRSIALNLDGVAHGPYVLNVHRGIGNLRQKVLVR